MSTFRFFIRAPLLILWVLFGLILAIVFFPILGQATRRWFVLRMSRSLMWISGVLVCVSGPGPVQDRPVLLISNHVSWLDIFVLNSLRSTSFIAKSEIKRWPVVGWLVRAAGTVFIERGQRHAIKTVGQQMNRCFERGDAIGLFPEGTTTTGLDVRHFHASLFEAAITLGVDVQPVALRYFQHSQRTERFAFVGDQSLVANIWILLSAKGVCVQAHFLSPFEAEQCAQWGRSQTATHTYDVIRAVVTDLTTAP